MVVNCVQSHSRNSTNNGRNKMTSSSKKNRQHNLRSLILKSHHVQVLKKGSARINPEQSQWRPRTWRFGSSHYDVRRPYVLIVTHQRGGLSAVDTKVRARDKVPLFYMTVCDGGESETFIVTTVAHFAELMSVVLEMEQTEMCL